ncbi:hypothetical protein HYW76_03260 [Candidatus Pacearchaeota archaeon]|nr:hypothetical protein [Candidatus Pacearchaeota archaeon]
MIAKIKLRGEIVEIPGVEKAEGMGKIKGLMFGGEKSPALLFSFDKEGKEPIHSLFCPDFLAVWMKSGKIVEYRLIMGSKFFIKPKKEFDQLLEIPYNKKYADKIKKFLK